MLIVMIFFPLFSWASIVPNCSDEKVTNRIKQYITDKMIAVFLQQDPSLKNDNLKYAFHIYVNNIITQNMNKKLGSYICNANLEIYFLDKEFAKFPISYRVKDAENSDEGFYLTLR